MQFFQHQKKIHKFIDGLGGALSGVGIPLTLYCGFKDDEFISIVVWGSSSVGDIERLGKFLEKLKTVELNPISKSEEVLVKTGFKESDGESIVRIKWVKIPKGFGRIEVLCLLHRTVDNGNYGLLSNFVSKLEAILAEFEKFEAQCKHTAPSIKII